MLTQLGPGVHCTPAHSSLGWTVSFPGASVGLNLFRQLRWFLILPSLVWAEILDSSVLRGKFPGDRHLLIGYSGREEPSESQSVLVTS